jgi:hypothetical protein
MWNLFDKLNELLEIYKNSINDVDDNIDFDEKDKLSKKFLSSHEFNDKNGDGYIIPKV